MQNNIENYPNYHVDKSGQIFNIKFNRRLKHIKTKNGYLTIHLCNKKSKIFLVHRLVAIAFIPNPDNLREVNHKNGIKTDNRVENLEWCSSSDNQKHAYKLGLQLPTNYEKNPKAKLTKEKVEKIRELHLNGYTSEYLQKEYSISQSNISRILNNKIWNYA